MSSARSLFWSLTLRIEPTESQRGTFKPYIPDDQVLPEFTPRASILGMVFGVVFGAVTGNIHAAGRLELRQSASVAGDIFAGRLSIEESATIKGRVELKAAEQSSAQTTRTAPDGNIQETLVLEPKA